MHPSTMIDEFENVKDVFENDRSPSINVSEIVNDIVLLLIDVFPNIRNVPIKNIELLLIFKMFKFVVLVETMVILLKSVKLTTSSVHRVSLLEQVFELLHIQFVEQSEFKHLLSQYSPK